jgi:hypothetical protein
MQVYVSTSALIYGWVSVIAPACRVRLNRTEPRGSGGMTFNYGAIGERAEASNPWERMCVGSTCRRPESKGLTPIVPGSRGREAAAARAVG